MVKNSRNISKFIKNLFNIRNPSEQSEIFNRTNDFKQIQDKITIGSFEYFIANEEIHCSTSCYDIFGFKNDEKITINDLLSCVHEDDYDDVKQLLMQTAKDYTDFSSNFRIYHAQTKELRYIALKTEVFTQNNKSIKMIGIVQDTTEKMQFDQHMINMNHYYKYIFDHLHTGIWMRQSINGPLIFASKGLEELLQIPLTTLYQDPDCWKEMVLPMYRDELFNKYKTLKDGVSIEHKYRIKTANGVTKWVYEQTIPKVNDYGKVTHIFGMVTDVSSEIEVQQKLQFLAKNDPLTTLPNRHSLHEQINDFIQRDDIHYFSLFYVDLDNFHWIIEDLGYEIGDIVLKTIANRIVNTLPQDSYIARADSDSFIFVLFDQENEDNIFSIAHRVMQAIKHKIKAKAYEVYVTASIGVCFYPDNGEDHLTLLKNAHAALYHAKKLGKNNYQIYSLKEDMNFPKKHILEQDLRQALKNDAFKVFYQPKVNPKTKAIEGAEALIRWNHDKWGLVPPDDFIPLAEEKHLIHHISYWMIHEVLKQLNCWQEQNYTLYPISINLSPLTLLRQEVVETVKNALDRFQIPAKYIELEITESSLLKNEKIVSKTIQALKALGVKIALDDFGTKYSSFHYLQTFAIDTLKIDQTFIQSLKSADHTKTKEAAIVSSFLHLAKGLGMTTVAEGVEEYEQLEFLLQKECDIIQGYIYSKPVPADKFAEMMKARYLKPKKQKTYIKPEKERRKYFRFYFPQHLPATLNISHVNNRKVDSGYATILVENISLGGIRFLSTLKLPVNANVKFNFQIEMMNEYFNLDGTLVYTNEERPDIYAYGVSLQMSEGKRDQLAEIINKMTVFKKLNNNIPDTDLIEQDPYIYLRENSL